MFASIEECGDRHTQNSIISEEETTLPHMIHQRESYACSKSTCNEDNEEDVDVKREMSWLGDTFVDNEVHGILEWVMQNYNDVSMELAKKEMTVKDDDCVEDHWCMIMDKYLQKGIKCLLKICHFNKIQE